MVWCSLLVRGWHCRTPEGQQTVPKRGTNLLLHGFQSQTQTKHNDTGRLYRNLLVQHTHTHTLKVVRSTLKCAPITQFTLHPFDNEWVFAAIIKSHGFSQGLLTLDPCAHLKHTDANPQYHNPVHFLLHQTVYAQLKLYNSPWKTDTLYWGMEVSAGFRCYTRWLRLHYFLSELLLHSILQPWKSIFPSRSRILMYSKEK